MSIHWEDSLPWDVDQDDRLKQKQSTWALIADMLYEGSSSRLVAEGGSLADWQVYLLHRQMEWAVWVMGGGYLLPDQEIIAKLDELLEMPDEELERFILQLIRIFYTLIPGNQYRKWY